MIRFLRLIAAVRFRSCRVPHVSHLHMRSRFSFGLMVPQRGQATLLEDHLPPDPAHSGFGLKA